MRTAYETYQDDGFVVLSVSIQENDTAVADFIARYGLTYPFLMDRDGQISREYRVVSTPTTYFIGLDGVITDVLPGVVGEWWLEQNIAAVASG